MQGKLFINGEWTGESLDVIEVVNPATGETIGTVPNGNTNEARMAIESAQLAFEEWSSLTAGEKSSYLMKWYDLIMENKHDLAKMITLEMGKPLAEAIGEIEYAASFISWYAEEAKRIYGRTIPGSTTNKRIQVMKQPIGVVACITPWNFPAAMITRKMAPALAAGCTVVIKPSELTPFTAIKLFQLCEKAGFPKGVVNLVMGDAANIGKEMTSNNHVKKLTFTGSTNVGKILIQQSADHVQNLSLELGGHAPAIVFEDADLEKAVNGVITSKYRNGGQTCICSNRIYVHEQVLEEFIEKFTRKVTSLKVGSGLEESTNIGPLINENAYEKVNRHVQDAISNGATLHVGGDGVSQNGAYFYQPTVLSGVSDDMLIMNEETFGPVAPIQTFRSDEEAIEKANNSPFGLAAYFFTENYARGQRVAEKLQYGIIGWNDGAPSVAQAPFGGMKESGIGREGGTEGLDAFLETKYVSISI